MADPIEAATPLIDPLLDRRPADRQAVRAYPQRSGDRQREDDVLTQVPAASERDVAMAALVAEVERLRTELDVLQHHAEWLEGRCDRHPVLGVLHIQAFRRECARLMNQSEQGKVPGTLLSLKIDGLRRARAEESQQAYESLLVRAAELLTANLRQTDLLAYVEDGEFVLALALADPEGSAAKAGQLAAVLAGHDFIWHDRHYPVVVAIGAAPFRDGESVDVLLTEAARARQALPAAEGGP